MFGRKLGSLDRIPNDKNEKHRPESIWHKAGIALAWLSLLQLGLDMAENYCFWQFAQGRESESLKSGYLFLEKAKKPVFIASALYILGTSIRVWFRVLPK